MPNMGTTIESLFDLIAPIAITGGADCCYMKKAKEAWKQIVALRNEIPWGALGCRDPRDLFIMTDPWNLDDNNDFDAIYFDWAKPMYDRLFEEIVNQHGDEHWGQVTHDYWGAKGFERPGDTNKSLSLAGDAGEQYPWYETAELLIERIKKLEKERPNTDRLASRG